MFDTLPPTESHYGPIPIYPQPGIFETTVAYNMSLGDEFGAEYGVITAEDVEQILNAPPWSVEAFRREVECKMATDARVGWGIPERARAHHFFELVTMRSGRIASRSLCKKWEADTQGSEFMPDRPTIPLSPTVDAFDPNVVLCTQCVKRKPFHDMRQMKALP